MYRFTSTVVIAVALLTCACTAPSEEREPEPMPDPMEMPDPPPPEAPVDAFAKLAQVPAFCSDNQWCWRAPTPTGNDYIKVFSTGKDNTWLIGQHGTVLQWNGVDWKVHQTDTLPGQNKTMSVYAIAGRGANDMWLLAGNTVQHWNGREWKVKDSVPPNGLQSFNSIWQAPNGDVWVTMNTGFLARSVGGTGVFERIDTGCNCYLGSVWGAASDEFWISTLPGNLMRSDGRSFTTVYNGGTPIGSFTGTAKDDIWVSGSDGELLHWNGAAWSVVETGLDSGFLGATAALGKDDVSWWWASNSSAASGFVHWNGRELTVTPVDTSALGVFLYSTAIIDGKWWMVGGAGAVYTRRGDNAISSVIDPQVVNLQSMWGTSVDEMYYATGGRILKWNGRSLAAVQPAIPVSSISGVPTSRGNEIFGVGFELSDDRSAYIANAFHYDGTAWTKAQLERAPISEHRYFTKVWTIAPGEAMAVGYGGIAYYFANNTWRRVETGTTADLLGVWGANADQVLISGTDGTLLKWERTRPEVALPDPSLATDDDLGAMHGANGTVWIAAGYDSVLRGDASGWTKIPTNMAVDSLFVISDRDVVISSASQSLLARWNGSAFVQEDNASAVPTPVLFKPGNGPMLAGGLRSLVQHP